VARKKRKARRFSSRSNRSPQEALVKALNHPVRVKALTILSEKTASPKEIAEVLDVPLSNVSYHVRVLDELGLIEIVEEESVRGSVAHFYEAVERPLIDNPDWGKLDPKVRSVVSGNVVEMLISDAAASLAAGLFDRRRDRHLSRMPLVLDGQGWRDVSRAQAEAEAAIIEAQAAAAERLKRGGEAINAVAGMFCFEVPAAPEG
jgi:DNA-binding transcriptional ArsR family regulator